MRETLRRIASLLDHLGHSGPGIFACSLVIGLVLGSSSLICLELLYEDREEAYRVASSSETTKYGAQATSQPGSPAKQPTENGQDKPPSEPRKDEAGGEGSGEDAEREAGERESQELEAKLQDITSEYPGEYGVLVWQPGSETRVAVGSKENFGAASLAKLPVLLALYRDAAEGRLALDEEITMRPEDIRSYGTGVLHKYPAGTVMTLRDCAEYLMQESDNTAWAMLERRLGKDRIRRELDSAGASSSRYDKAGHTTSPEDTLKLLRRISDPGYTSPEHSREMLSTMTGTAFEDRLPQGLPEDARIHHKIGSLGDSFGDAGMVTPAEKSGGAYYIVVLSRDAGGEAKARSAMREISLAAYRELVDAEARPRSSLEGPGSGRGQQDGRDQPA